MDDPAILICYDDTEGARRAIESAARLFPSRRAVVLDVAPPVTVGEGYATLGAITPKSVGLNLDEAWTRARRGAELAGEAGLSAEARADVATPTWDGVVEVADEIDAAVVVVGSRGRGGFSHEVVEHAGRPVLIVPPPR